MRQLKFKIQIAIHLFWAWMKTFTRPKFKIGDIVVAKQDAYGASIVDHVYLKVYKIDKYTVYTRNSKYSNIYYNHTDIVKVELSELEKIIHGVN